MDEAAVLALLGLAGSAFSTLWAAGGWRALKRRKIQQEVDIAKGLGDGSKMQKHLLRNAEDEIAIYLYRTRGQPPTGVSQAFGVFLLALFVVVVVASLFPDPSFAVIYTFEGLLALSVGWLLAAALRAGWVRLRKSSYDDLLSQARKELGLPQNKARAAADTAGSDPDVPAGS
jgi:hypothetical protein